MAAGKKERGKESFSNLVSLGNSTNSEFNGVLWWYRLFNFGVGLHLIEGIPPERSKEIRPTADHFSFQCENIREVEAQLQALNVKYISDEIEHEGFHISQVRRRVLILQLDYEPRLLTTVFSPSVPTQKLFFHDPDNNMIEICNCDSAPLTFLQQGEHCSPMYNTNNSSNQMVAAPQNCDPDAIKQVRPQWQSGH